MQSEHVYVQQWLTRSQHIPFWQSVSWTRRNWFWSTRLLSVPTTNACKHYRADFNSNVIRYLSLFSIQFRKGNSLNSAVDSMANETTDSRLIRLDLKFYLFLLVHTPPSLSPSTPRPLLHICLTPECTIFDKRGIFFETTFTHRLPRLAQRVYALIIYNTNTCLPNTRSPCICLLHQLNYHYAAQVCVRLFVRPLNEHGHVFDRENAHECISEMHIVSLIVIDDRQSMVCERHNQNAIEIVRLTAGVANEFRLSRALAKAAATAQHQLWWQNVFSLRIFFFCKTKYVRVA